MTINGALKVLVLRILSDGKKRGASITREIKEKTNWRVSPGSFYPLMKELVNSKLVSYSKESNIKIYRIRKAGRKFLGNVDQIKRQMMANLNESMGFLKVLGEDETEFVDFKKRMEENPFRFAPVYEEIHNLEMAFRDLDIQKNSSEVRKILNDARKKLEKLK